MKTTTSQWPSVVSTTGPDAEPNQKTIRRWQSLFRYTHEQAVKLIRAGRRGEDRLPVGTLHWLACRLMAEPAGYDQEAFQHMLNNMQGKFLELLARREEDEELERRRSPAVVKADYYLMATGPFTDCKLVILVAKLGHFHSTMYSIRNRTTGVEEQFYRMTGLHKYRLNLWLTHARRYHYEYMHFRPAFSLVEMAHKDLVPGSSHPTMGSMINPPADDPGLMADLALVAQNQQTTGDGVPPQHHRMRLYITLPTQDQYPVWYFFYDSLRRPEALAQALGHGPGDLPHLSPAYLMRVERRMFDGGRRMAVADSDQSDKRLDGAAYLVRTRKEEDRLRMWFGSMYEVVRCQIRREGSCVKGCTIRYIGKLDPRT
ncbi:hypothetical protein PVAG01_00996 [Phlyctema vagabunda]|uniref:Uncharacterized protein n=1 Tax=Phlyctema vagabunda TaxID=108571 RepID=A0ABR4PVV5_9HELO